MRTGTESIDAMASPSVVFLGIADSKAKFSMTSPSLQFTSEAKTKFDLPFPLIVGQESIKTALVLLAANPSIGGLVIAGFCFVDQPFIVNSFSFCSARRKRDRKICPCKGTAQDYATH
jgi:hypothetical protein